MINCICEEQTYENRIRTDEYLISDGFYFEDNKLVVSISYEETSLKVNYCPVCGKKIGGSRND